MGQATTTTVIIELKKLKKKLGVERMLLFGSWARGEELLNSDADVIVVSPRYQGVPFHRRADTFLEKWLLPIDLEILCYSPGELKRKQKEYGIVREALRTGKDIS